MEIMSSLFGDWSLVRKCGRISQPGHIRADCCHTEAAATGARFDDFMKKKSD